MNEQTPSSNKAIQSTEVRSRLLWASQPIVLIFALLFWVLNPEVADQASIASGMVGAFVFGLLIAIVGKWQDISILLDLGSKNSSNNDVYRKNRVPEEFYWGHKEKILFSKPKK